MCSLNEDKLFFTAIRRNYTQPCNLPEQDLEETAKTISVKDNTEESSM
jgi:hypothetical protein